MAINPAIEGYSSVKKGGKQGDVKLAKALGNNYHQSPLEVMRSDMDEGSSNNNPRSKMLDREEYPRWYP
jgi:hypothetical protein